MAQVKFYSVSGLPENAAEGGVYFVNGGELYKGSSRFGANKVFTAGEGQDLASFASVGQIGGDILVGLGAAKVWDPSTGASGSWVDLGADNSALQSLWRADISSWTASLAVGDANSYITSISQGNDGKVTAHAAAFPTLATGDADGQVKLGSTNATVSGWAELVSSVADNASDIDTLESKVSAIEGIVDASNSAVTASTGTFTNLTVTSTATFSVTAVSANSLTINGSTVEQIAQSEISAATLTGSISSSTGTSLVNEGQVVNYVSAAISSFDNAMHFRGVVASTASVTSPASGDIVVIGAEPTGGAVAGQEYIYNGTDWELIGDQNTYATAAAVSSALANKASVGTGTATASYGVSGEVVLTANAAPTMSIVVAPVTTSAGIVTASTSLATAGAIADYVTGVVAAATPATSTEGDSDKGVQVSVTTTSGVVTSVDVVTTFDTTLSANANNAPTTKAVYDALCWLDASGTPIS